MYCAGSGKALKAAGYSSRSTSRNAVAAACRPAATAPWAASIGFSSPGSQDVLCMVG
jgi:hypothetical protein